MSCCLPKRLLLAALVTLMGLVSAHAAEAQGDRWFVLAREIAVPVNVDGVLEEACWKQSPTLPLLFDRLQPLPARSATRIWLACDQATLYVAAEALDENCVKNRDVSSSPTLSLPSSAHFLLRLKSVQEESPFSAEFCVGPFGAATQSRNGNAQWNGAWKAAARPNANGYVIEMAIPLALLETEKVSGNFSVEFIRNVLSPHPEVQSWPWLDAQSTRTVYLQLKDSQKSSSAKTSLDSPEIFVARYAAVEALDLALWQSNWTDEESLPQELLKNALERCRAVANLAPQDLAQQHGMEPSLAQCAAQMETWLQQVMQAQGKSKQNNQVLDIEVPVSGAQCRLIVTGEEIPDEPLPLVIALHPRGVSAQAFSAALAVSAQKSAAPFILACPSDVSQFGDCSFFSNEVLTELLDEVGKMFACDPRRVHLIGYREGGTAAVKFASQMPDRFASVVSIDGPAETTLIKNLSSVSVSFYCLGEDKTLPTDHWANVWEKQRQPLEILGSLTILDAAKTSNPLQKVATAEFWSTLLDVKQPKLVKRVAFTVPSLEHARAYWVQAERLTSYPPDAHLEFSVTGDNVIEGTAKGIGAVSIDLTQPMFTPDRDVKLTINGTSYYEGAYRPKLQVDLQRLKDASPAMKTIERSGPLDEAFNLPAVYVWGTLEPGVWEEAMREAAVRASRREDASEFCPAISDEEFLANPRKDATLFLFGGPAKNAVTAELADKLPVAFGPNGLSVEKRTFGEKDLVGQFLCPSPWDDRQYVVVHWTKEAEMMRIADWTPDPTRFQLLPDGFIDKIERDPTGKVAHLRVADWWFAGDWLGANIRMAQLPAK